MNILLTNDDGIKAKGINSLYNILSQKHNIYMIAPNSEKSGCSSALTLKKHLKIKTINENKFAVHGFTADCVNIGLKGNIIPKVDMVISGINHGPNLGDDIYFSGTVAGARLAFMYGITGIAISLDSAANQRFFDDASRFLLNYLDDLDSVFKSKVFLNINCPDIPVHEITGVKYSKLGKRIYRDSYNIINKNGKEINMRLNFGTSESKDFDTDIEDVKNGYISITPLMLDCTDYKNIKS